MPERRGGRAAQSAGHDGKGRARGVTGRANIELPDYIGLGKSISLGKGTIKREKDGGNI